MSSAAPAPTPSSATAPTMSFRAPRWTTPIPMRCLPCPRPRRRSSGWCSTSPSTHPRWSTPVRASTTATGTIRRAEQEAVLAGIENIYSQFSSLVKFSLDPAEITQLQGMTQAQLAQIDLTPADVTTLAGLVNPTFQSQVYDGGAGNYETIYFNDTPVFNAGLSSGGVSAAATANLSGGAVTGLTITSGGAGYDSVPSVTLLSGAGAAAVATVSSGALTGIAITSVGAGYTSAPTVSITGGGGSGATATAVVTGGQVTAINITSAGTGYTSAPTITLISGSGAMATAILGVSAAVIANPGSGYTSAPTVTISGGGGTGATATAVITGGQVTAINITNPGSGYTSPPTITLTGGGYTTVAAATAVCSVIRARRHGARLGLHLTPDRHLRHALAWRLLQRGRLRQPEPEDDCAARRRTASWATPAGLGARLDCRFVQRAVRFREHVDHDLGARAGSHAGPGAHGLRSVPIGFGISNPPGDHSYYPNYAGPVGAFTTQGDVIASPASVGSTLANAADGLAQLGRGTRSRWRSSPTGPRWPRTSPTRRTRPGPACRRRRWRRPADSRPIRSTPDVAGVATVRLGPAGEPVRPERAQPDHHGLRRRQDVRRLRRGYRRLHRRQPGGDSTPATR